MSDGFPEHMRMLPASLRERARHARAEKTATATADAWYFEQAADRIDALTAAVHALTAPVNSVGTSPSNVSTTDQRAPD